MAISSKKYNISLFVPFPDDKNNCMDEMDEKFRFDVSEFYEAFHQHWCEAAKSLREAVPFNQDRTPKKTCWFKKDYYVPCLEENIGQLFISYIVMYKNGKNCLRPAVIFECCCYIQSTSGDALDFAVELAEFIAEVKKSIKFKRQCLFSIDNHADAEKILLSSDKKIVKPYITTYNVIETEGLSQYEATENYSKLSLKICQSEGFHCGPVEKQIYRMMGNLRENNDLSANIEIRDKKEFFETDLQRLYLNNEAFTTIFKTLKINTFKELFQLNTEGFYFALSLKKYHCIKAL